MTSCAKHSSDGKPLSRTEIESWKNDEDILKSLQGTWVMTNDEYYGKRKFKFEGKTGRSWKMESGSNEWKDDGKITFDYTTKYEFNTKMNQGAEYSITYDTDLGSITFDVNVISGLFVKSDRYTYGISLERID
jgi:hypothetical protein